VTDQLDLPIAIDAIRGSTRRLGTLRRSLLHKPVAAAAVVVVVLLILIAVFAPLIAPFNPNKPDLLNVLKSPSSHHLFGTDDIGRDVFSRLLFGARTSLLAAVEAIGISTAVGLPLGVIAGYFGGLTDAVLSRTNDAIMSVPNIMLALTVVTVFGPGLTHAMIAIGIIFIPRTYRVMRAAAHEVHNQPYVEAARVIGCRRRRVLLAHVLPNALSPLVVVITVSVGTAILAESGLSFLGLGVQAPTSSWGGMLAAASKRLDLKYLLIAPGVALAITVAAFTLVGDALTEALGTAGRDRP
jgi:peptide/nickel transport system permease protein